MNYIVLDLEWNQPRYYRETVENPVHLSGEIIQIGAVKLGRNFKIKKEYKVKKASQYSFVVPSPLVKQKVTKEKVCDNIKLSDFNDYKPNDRSKKTVEFVEENWNNYVSEFSVVNLLPNEQEILVKEILARIIYQSNTINCMKEKNLL